MIRSCTVRKIWCAQWTDKRRKDGWAEEGVKYQSIWRTSGFEAKFSKNSLMKNKMKKYMPKL